MLYFNFKINFSLKKTFNKSYLIYRTKTSKNEQQPKPYGIEEHMKKIITIFVFTAHLVTSVNALASGLCYHLRTRDICNSFPSGACCWDEVDQRCESICTCLPPDPCASVYNMQDCTNSSPNCLWDEDDRRCYTEGRPC